VLTDPVGDRVAGDGLLGVEVDDRLDGDLRPGLAAPRLDLVEQNQQLALLEPSGRPEHRGLAVGGRGEVGVEHDLTGDGQAVPVARIRVALGVEVERSLGAGEVTEGLGAAHVQGLGGPERLLGFGAVGQDPVEIEAVGDVEVGLEVHGAGEMDVLVVEGGVARVDRQVAVLRVSSRVHRLELEPLDGLGD